MHDLDYIVTKYRAATLQLATEDLNLQERVLRAFRDHARHASTGDDVPQAIAKRIVELRQVMTAGPHDDDYQDTVVDSTAQFMDDDQLQRMADEIVDIYGMAKAAKAQRVVDGP